MSEEYFISSTNHCVCKEKSGRKLGEKAKKSFVKVAEMQKDDLITAALSIVTSVWLSDASYNRYVHTINVNKTMTISDKCTRDQPNQSFERWHRSAPFADRTHCLVCKGELNFDLTEIKADIAKCQTSEVRSIIMKKKKCKYFKGDRWKNWSVGSRVSCEVILRLLFTCWGIKISRGLYTMISE